MKPGKALVRMKASAATNVVLDEAITVSAIDHAIVVDLSKLTAPDRIYDADYAWVRHRPGRVSLFFGKANIDDPTKALRSRIELRYGPDYFVRHFWKTSTDFRKALEAHAGRWPFDAEREAIDPAKLHSERDHSEWVNIQYMANVGTEAAVDFYHMPATGIAKYATGQGNSGLRIVAVMRVQLTSQELVRLFRACDVVAEEIQSYLPADDLAVPQADQNSQEGQP